MAQTVVVDVEMLRRANEVKVLSEQCFQDRSLLTFKRDSLQGELDRNIKLTNKYKRRTKQLGIVSATLAVLILIFK